MNSKKDYNLMKDKYEHIEKIIDVPNGKFKKNSVSKIEFWT